MHILFDGNWDNREIEISDSSDGLIELGNTFLHLNKNIMLDAEQEESDFYPKNIENISLKLNHEDKNNIDQKLV
jgi:hypothetical protein